MADLDPATALLVQKIQEISQDPESIMTPFDPSRAPFVRSENSNHGQWAMPDRSAVQRFRAAFALSESFIGPYADLPVNDDANFTKARIQKTKYKFCGEFDKRWKLPQETKILLRRQFTFVDSLMRTQEGLPVGNELRDAGNHAVHDPDYTLRPFVFPKPGAPNDGVQMYLVTDNAFQHISGAVDTTRNVLHAAEDDDDVDPNDEQSSEDSNPDSMIKWADPADKFSLIPQLHEFIVNTNIQAFDIDGNWVHPRDYRTVFPAGTWIDVDFYCCLWDYSQSNSSRDASPPSKTYQSKALRLQVISHPLPDANLTRSFERPAKKRKVDFGGLPLPKPRRTIEPSPSSSLASSTVADSSNEASEMPVKESKKKITNKPAMSTGKKRLFSLKGKGKESTNTAQDEEGDANVNNMIVDND